MPLDNLPEQSGDKTEIPSLEPLNLASAARQVLQNNDAGAYTMPARGLYPHQWLWDSCFIAIGQRHYDIDRAQTEILSLLRGQWINGMFPNIIINPAASRDEPHYRKHEKIWHSWLNPHAPDDALTSGITQPPMVAEAVVRIGEHLSSDEQKKWYSQVYQSLVSYHLWLYRERDPHNEGLVLQIHPWETGLDNTPPWMHELHEHLLPGWIRAVQTLKLDSLIGWFRTDKRFVGADQRTSTIESLALFDVQRRLRRKNYDFNRYIDHALFAIEDLSYNCIFLRANQHLRSIAEVLGKELPAELVHHMDKSEAALEQLWDEHAQEYFSRDFVSHRLLNQSSIAALLPLYAGCITKERAKVLVAMLENEHRFGTAYPVPTAPLDSPWFAPHRYWQGPTWINMNWLIIDGLTRYGFHEHAAALRESTLEMVQHHGFFEYFSPLDGSGAGTPDFSWTASLVLDFIHQEETIQKHPR